MSAASPRPEGLSARAIRTLATRATPPVSTWDASSWTCVSRSCRPRKASGSPRRAVPAAGAGRSACSSLTGLLLLLPFGGALGRQVRRLLGIGDDHHPGLAAGRAAGRRSGLLALVLVLVL